MVTRTPLSSSAVLSSPRLCVTNREEPNKFYCEGLLPTEFQYKYVETFILGVKLAENKDISCPANIWVWKLTYYIYLFLNINQLDALNFIVSLFQASTCVHRQEGTIVLYSLWYHHTYRWPSLAQVHRTATYKCDDTRDCIIQFSPPDDEHMCSKHVKA